MSGGRCQNEENNNLYNFFLTFLSLKSFADTYWGSDFLTADEAQKNGECLRS